MTKIWISWLSQRHGLNRDEKDNPVIADITPYYYPYIMVHAARAGRSKGGGTRSSDELAHIIVDQPTISDHACVIFSVDITKPPLPTREISYRKIMKIDTRKFKEDIQSSCLISMTSNDVDELTEAYDSVLQKILDHHAPLKKRTITVHPVAPWYNQAVNEAKQEKRQAERVWRQTGLTVHRQIFQERRNNVTSLITSSKRDYYQQKITESSQSQQSLFKCLSELLNKAKSTILPEHACATELSNRILNFFHEKIEKIRLELQNIQRMEGLTNGPEYCKVPEDLQFLTIAARELVSKPLL